MQYQKKILNFAFHFSPKTDFTMLRMKRKLRERRNDSKSRVASIKRLNAKPVIKNVDIEAIKATFKTAEAQN